MAQMLGGVQSLALTVICGYCGKNTDVTKVEDRDGKPVAVRDFSLFPGNTCKRCGGPMDPDKVKAFSDMMAIKGAAMYGPGVGRVEVPKTKSGLSKKDMANMQAMLDELRQADEADDEAEEEPA